jgi:phage terminase large subunit GpA-like protein
MLNEIFKKSIFKIQEKIYSYRNVRLEPSEWIEKNIYLTSAESRYPGFFSYDRSPYTKEVVDCLSVNSDVECVAVMKCSQSGFTAGVVTTIIPYIISETPSNILFLSGSETLVQDTVRDRLDPIIQNSGLSHLIRPNVFKKKNQKSGDTDFKKEFAGGSLTGATYNPRRLRFYSAKFIIADEFDDAPRADKKEGSIRSLLENRAKSFGSTKKICYISSPTVAGQSNIEEVYELGDKRKLNWCCPHCENYIPIEWRIEKEDETFAGIKYELDEEKKLIPESVHYECQNCGGKIDYSQKYDLNLTAKWIPTAKPKKPSYRSYQLNALVIPPGFDSWVDLVYQWLECCPPDGRIDDGKLKTFKNTQLGQTWQELGKTPRVNEMMTNNVRSYDIGVVPDVTCKNDGNGRIVLLTLACDLGGVMETNNEDVRLDWELIAHASNGQTYSVNHGSIGTFKRNRKKTNLERSNESERDKYTYSHGQRFSVWPVLKKLIDKNYIGQSGDAYNIDITVIDTGFFTRLAYDFIKGVTDAVVVGVKGYTEDEYRKLNRDTPVIQRSREMQNSLYILQVNQLKDILASNMKLAMGMDGFQPYGFMNFPQSSMGKYAMKSYFSHFEAEHRVPLMKGDIEIGYAWKKKNSDAENHFFDVYVYSLASREIYIDILRKSYPKYSKLTWDDFVSIVDG